MRGHFLYNYIKIISIFQLAFFSLTASVSAFPWMTLRVIPDRREIRLDGELEELRLLCRVREEGVLFEWELERGPGRLDGNLTSRKVTYVLPETLEGASREVVIVRVTAINKQGEALSDQATFTLLAGETERSLEEGGLSSPSETSETEAFLKQMSGSASAAELEKLLQQADMLVMQSFYVEPEEENAFALYQQVLKKEPNNRHARRQLHKILQDYVEWGDDAYYQKKYAKARRYYQRYCLVAEYMLDTLGITELSASFQKMRRRLKELEPEKTPTPGIDPEKKNREKDVDLDELQDMLRKE